MKTLKTKLLIIFVAVFSFAFANNTFLTDLPAQIKVFVNQNRTFINKTKTIPNCQNLYNVFATIERDADKDLSADDISTRFNQAYRNDNPSGEAMKHYEMAYGLFTKAFKTDKVDFVNPSPQKPTEKADRLPYISEYASFTTPELWNSKEMTLEIQQALLEANGIDAKKAREDYMKKIIEENKKLEKDTKNQ